MTTAVQRWGNSLALRIPKAFALEAQLDDGAEVDLRMKGGSIVISRSRRKRYQLKDLLSKITADNIHSSIDTGSPVGREEW
jgi:antitoxin MazE